MPWFSYHGGHSGEFARHAEGSLEEVVESANQFAEGARVIAESSANLSDGAQNQAASVEQMTSAVEEMTSAIQVISASASDSKAQAERTATIADNAGKIRSEAEGSMRLIEKSSEQITDIIQVISGPDAYGCRDTAGFAHTIDITTVARGYNGSNAHRSQGVNYCLACFTIARTGESPTPKAKIDRSNIEVIAQLKYPLQSFHR